MAVRITQAGVALTVGIIIVTGLIIGGFFWVKTAGEQARRDDAIKIAEQNLEKQSDKDIALNDGEASDKDANESTKDEATSSENGTKTENTAGEDAADENTVNQGENAAEQPATELPRTGPADQLMALLVTGLLTFSVASYLSSRQTRTDVY